jgi:hypothetical protein
MLYVSSRRLYKLWADQPKWVQFMGALEFLKLQTTTTTNFSFSPSPPLCKSLHTSILDLSYSTKFYFLLADLCNISWHEKHDFKHIQRVFCNISWHEKLWFQTYTKGFSHGKNGPNLPDFKDFFCFFFSKLPF